MMTPSDQARFDAKLDKTGSCWEWQGATYQNGYGQVRLRTKLRLAHRVAAVQAGLIVDIDSPMEIDHVCQNKKCCNPAHLQAMTKTQHRRKTHACGEIVQTGASSNSAKLTDDKVLEIHQKYSTGNFSQRKLAEMYGVSQGTICPLLSGETWNHIFKNFHGIS